MNHILRATNSAYGLNKEPMTTWKTFTRSQLLKASSYLGIWK